MSGSFPDNDSKGPPAEAISGQARSPVTHPALPAEKENNLWYYRGTGDSVLVFVHGIFSDSRNCWLRDVAPVQYWPALIRSDRRFGDVSIYLGGYGTAIDAGDYDLGDCAQELRKALWRPEMDGAPSVMRSARRIFFVCHSTGGIVVRNMLERWARDFRDHAIGVALIASPSLGSDWANTLEGLAAFYNLQLGLRLRVGDATLQDVDDRFRDLLEDKEIPTLIGGEAYENRFILHVRGAPNWGALVTRAGQGGYWGAPVHLRNTDHFSTVKPDRADHPGHQFLVDTWLKFVNATGGDATLGAWVQSTPPVLPKPQSARNHSTRFGVGAGANWPLLAFIAAFAVILVLGVLATPCSTASTYRTASAGTVAALQVLLAACSAGIGVSLVTLVAPAPRHRRMVVTLASLGAFFLAYVVDPLRVARELRTCPNVVTTPPLLRPRHTGSIGALFDHVQTNVADRDFRIEIAPEHRADVRALWVEPEIRADSYGELFMKICRAYPCLSCSPADVTTSVRLDLGAEGVTVVQDDPRRIRCKAQ